VLESETAIGDGAIIMNHLPSRSASGSCSKLSILIIISLRMQEWPMASSYMYFRFFCFTLALPFRASIFCSTKQATYFRIGRDIMIHGTKWTLML